MVSIGPLNPVSGSASPGEEKVTAVTGWGMLRDGLLSPLLTCGAQLCVCVCVCVCESEGEEWALSTGAANLQPTTDTQTHHTKLPKASASLQRGEYLARTRPVSVSC